MMETAPSPLSPQESTANGISPSSLAIDPDKVVEYLAAVVTIALGATREDLGRDGNLLSPAHHADTIQKCIRFAGDSQVVLYIQKEVESRPDVADGPSGVGMYIQIMFTRLPPYRAASEMLRLNV